MKRWCERAVGAQARSCQACYNSKQKCEGAVWGATAGLIGGLKKPKVDEKGSLAEVVRVLGSEVGQIRGILDVGLVDLVDMMTWSMDDHRPEVPEEKWYSEDEAEVEEEVRELVVEKEAFREFLRERPRVRDVVQMASVSPKRTTEARADNKGSVAVEGVVEGGVADWGANGDLVDISSAEPAPES